MIVIVPAGETGVYELFGRVSDQEKSSGLHFVIPVARVIPISIRTEEYTMSIVQGEGVRYGADAITVLTSEGLKLDLDMTVFYRLQEDKASDIYTTLGLNYDEKIIRPEIRGGIREITAQYTAQELYSNKRDEAAVAIKDRLVSKLEPRGIIIEDVLIRNIQLPERLEASIQEKLAAEQEAQRMEFVLQKEEKEADRKIIEAEGQRDAQQIINQSLSSQYLQYLYIQNLQEREGTIYVPTDPNTGIPLFRGI
jgi:regulator of protease activity HflC (stomatin/prohibitin superfamily)